MMNTFKGSLGFIWKLPQETKQDWKKQKQNNNKTKAHHQASMQATNNCSLGQI